MLLDPFQKAKTTEGKCESNAEKTKLNFSVTVTLKLLRQVQMGGQRAKKPSRRSFQRHQGRSGMSGSRGKRHLPHQESFLLQDNPKLEGPISRVPYEGLSDCCGVSVLRAQQHFVRRAMFPRAILLCQSDPFRHNPMQGDNFPLRSFAFQTSKEVSTFMFPKPRFIIHKKCATRDSALFSIPNIIPLLFLGLLAMSSQINMFSPILGQGSHFFAPFFQI